MFESSAKLLVRSFRVRDDLAVLMGEQRLCVKFERSLPYIVPVATSKHEAGESGCFGEQQATARSPDDG